MQFQISRNADGKMVITDGQGNPVPWVDHFKIVSDPDGGYPVLYIGVIDFTSTITVGTAAAVPTQPAPAG